MSEKSNKANSSRLSDERLDNLYRILTGPANSVSEAHKVMEKTKIFLDNIYLEGYAEGLEAGMHSKYNEI